MNCEYQNDKNIAADQRNIIELDLTNMFCDGTIVVQENSQVVTQISERTKSEITREFQLFGSDLNDIDIKQSKVNRIQKDRRRYSLPVSINIPTREFLPSKVTQKRKSVTGVADNSRCKLRKIESLVANTSEVSDSNFLIASPLREHVAERTAAEAIVASELQVTTSMDTSIINQAVQEKVEFVSMTRNTCDQVELISDTVSRGLGKMLDNTNDVPAKELDEVNEKSNTLTPVLSPVGSIASTQMEITTPGTTLHLANVSINASKDTVESKLANKEIAVAIPSELSNNEFMIPSLLLRQDPEVTESATRTIVTDNLVSATVMDQPIVKQAAQEQVKVASMTHSNNDAIDLIQNQIRADSEELGVLDKTNELLKKELLELLSFSENANVPELSICITSKSELTIQPTQVEATEPEAIVTTEPVFTETETKVATISELPNFEFMIVSPLTIYDTEKAVITVVNNELNNAAVMDRPTVNEAVQKNVNVTDTAHEDVEVIDLTEDELACGVSDGVRGVMDKNEEQAKKLLESPTSQKIHLRSSNNAKKRPHSNSATPLQKQKTTPSQRFPRAAKATQGQLPSTSKSSSNQKTSQQHLHPTIQQGLQAAQYPQQKDQPVPQLQRTESQTVRGILWPVHGGIVQTVQSQHNSAVSQWERVQPPQTLEQMLGVTTIQRTSNPILRQHNPLQSLQQIVHEKRVQAAQYEQQMQWHRLWSSHGAVPQSQDVVPQSVEQISTLPVQQVRPESVELDPPQTDQQVRPQSVELVPSHTDQQVRPPSVELVSSQIVQQVHPAKTSKQRRSVSNPVSNQQNPLQILQNIVYDQGGQTVQYPQWQTIQEPSFPPPPYPSPPPYTSPLEVTEGPQPPKLIRMSSRSCPLSNQALAEKLLPHVLAFRSWRTFTRGFAGQVRSYLSPGNFKDHYSAFSGYLNHMLDSFGKAVIKELSTIEVTSFDLYVVCKQISASFQGRNYACSEFKILAYFYLMIKNCKSECQTPLTKRFFHNVTVGMERMEQKSNRRESEKLLFTQAQLKRLELQIHQYLGIKKRTEEMKRAALNISHPLRPRRTRQTSQVKKKKDNSEQKSQSTIQKHGSLRDNSTSSVIVISDDNVQQSSDQTTGMSESPQLCEQIQLSGHTNVSDVRLSENRHHNAPPVEELTTFIEEPPPLSNNANVVTSSQKKSQGRYYIDLTWIDDGDEGQMLEEVEECKTFQFKTEECQRNELDAYRQSVSPVDSGFGSPRPLIESTDNESYKCLCGKQAIYICVCNATMYCGPECQINDWTDHQKVCTRNAVH